MKNALDSLKHRRIRKSVKITVLFIVVLLLLQLGFVLGRFAVTAYNNGLLIDAYHINVDGRLRYVFQDLQEFHQYSEAYKDKFLFNVSEDASVRSIHFTKEFEIVPVRVREEELTSIDLFVEDLNRIDQEAWVYIVQPGDSIWKIGLDQQVRTSLIKRYNPDLDPDRIWPGDEVLLRPEDPYYDVEISIENIVREPVQYYTEYIRDATLLATQRIVVTPGVEGEKDVTYDIRLRNGYESRIDVVHENILVEATGAVVRVGTKRTLSRISSSNFGVTSGRLTSGYGSRIHPITGNRNNHTGIDIAAPTGTAIYAYAEGRVIAAGWQGSLGNAVTIDHGGGLVTRYGHLSRIGVSVGDRVGVGQNIGGVGSTGFSTGPHLHFEVILNGKFRNPFDYI